MCKRPLKGFLIPKYVKNKDPTKPYEFTGYDYKITSFKAHHIEKVCGVWQVSMDEWISPNCEDYVDNFIEIPCGKCVECQLDRSKDWANRCMFELLFHDVSECWFLTLTYDEVNVPHAGYLDNGCLYTLDKEDLQKFWKRLRRDQEYHSGEKSRLRYFACGEYGTNTYRPHYHAICYSLPLNDLVFWAKSKTGNPLFRSEYLEKIWKKGMVTISPVSWETCAYTARYVMKKADGYDKTFWTDIGIEPEFTLMSRRPGIGRDYYNLNKDKIYKFDEIVLDNGKKVKPPRYYDNLFEVDDPKKYSEIKLNRAESAEYTKLMKLSKTDLSYEEYLKVEEEKLRNKLKLLRREL